MLKSKQNYQKKIHTKRFETIQSSKPSVMKSLISQKISSVKSLYKHQKGRRQNFNHARKQSYLNSCYNKRKNDLLRITKENKKIYQRINSQKSNYDKKSLHKSHDSSCSLSRRSSIASFKNSKQSSRMSTSRKQKFGTHPVKPQKVQIQSRNVNAMTVDQVMNFQQLFTLEKKPIPKRQRKKSENLRSPCLEPIVESKLTAVKSNFAKQFERREIPLMDKKNLVGISSKKFKW